MTSKDDLVQWNLATSFYDKGDLQSAIKIYQRIKFSAKICFNIGQAYFFLGCLDLAISAFSEAIQKDEHLITSYFQRGIIYFNLYRYVDAQSDFEIALDKLRNKEFIDYKQIGFQKIYAYQILQNLIAVNVLRTNFSGADYLLYRLSTLSQKPKQPDIENLKYLVKGRHNIPIYKLPQEAIFRLSKSTSSNLEKKNYLGEAKVLHCANSAEDLTRLKGLCLSEHQASPQFLRRKISSEKVIKCPISKSCPTLHITSKKSMPRENIFGLSSIGKSYDLLPKDQSSPKFTKSKIAPDKFLKSENHIPIYKHLAFPDTATGENISDSIDQSNDLTAQMIALYDFDGEQDDDLTFRRGDIINIIRRINVDWVKGEVHGKQGIFPLSYAKSFQSCKKIQLIFQST